MSCSCRSAAGLPKTRAPSARRSMPPSALRTSGPNAAAMASCSAVELAYRSCTTASASITGSAPSSRSIASTVLLPAAMGPVMPITSMLALHQSVVLIDLTLVGIGLPLQHLGQHDLTPQHRRFQDGECGSQVVQPFTSAGLGVGAVLDGAQPVEVLDGIGVAQAQREDALPLRGAELLLEELVQRLALAAVEDQSAVFQAAARAHHRRRARHLQRLAVHPPRPPELTQATALEDQARQVGVVDVGMDLLDDAALRVAPITQRLEGAREGADRRDLAHHVAHPVHLVHADVDAASSPAQQLPV